jgi:hypothetical protein
MGRSRARVPAESGAAATPRGTAAGSSSDRVAEESAQCTEANDPGNVRTMLEYARTWKNLARKDRHSSATAALSSELALAEGTFSTASERPSGGEGRGGERQLVTDMLFREKPVKHTLTHSVCPVLTRVSQQRVRVVVQSDVSVQEPHDGGEGADLRTQRRRESVWRERRLLLGGSSGRSRGFSRGGRTSRRAVCSSSPCCCSLLPVGHRRRGPLLSLGRIDALQEARGCG